MATPNRPTLDARDMKVIFGLLEHMMDAGPFVLGGVTYTTTELAALFQGRIDSGNDVAAKRAAWLKAVQDDRALLKKVDAAYYGLREIVRQRFDNAPDALGAFPFGPKKVGKVDALTHLVAAAKRRATRAARHTMGPKQRLKIRGQLTPHEIVAAVVAHAVATQPALAVPPPGEWLNPYVVPASRSP